MGNIHKWLLPDWNTALIITVSVFLIFTLLVVIVRIAGLRTFAKMTSFDFATTIALGSVLATICINPETSIGNGSVALVAIVVFQVLFAAVQRRFSLFRKVMTNKPVLLMKDGCIIQRNLDSTNLHRSELIAKLREANVLRFDQVKAVVLESTGDVSVLHSDPKDGVQLEKRLLDFLK